MTFRFEGADMLHDDALAHRAKIEAAIRTAAHGLLNYFIPGSSLGPMAELFDRIVRVR